MSQKIGAWMKVNGEAIYATRPWKVCGEGPAITNAPSIKAQGFNEGKIHMGNQDIRFTTKPNTLYATVLGWPTAPVTIKSLGKSSGLLTQPIADIALLGSDEKLSWEQTDNGVVIQLPKTKPANDQAIVFKIALKS